MANNKLVPDARAGLDKFKMEAASDVGVSLNAGYNGDLTSKQAGSVGHWFKSDPRNHENKGF